MQPTADRLLTTHSGSLARPPELIQLLVDRSNGEVVDRATFDPLVADAVCEVVRR